VKKRTLTTKDILRISCGFATITKIEGKTHVTAIETIGTIGNLYFVLNVSIIYKIRVGNHRGWGGLD